MTRSESRVKIQIKRIERQFKISMILLRNESVNRFKQVVKIKLHLPKKALQNLSVLWYVALQCSIHPFSTIASSTVARYFARIVFKVKFIVIIELQIQITNSVKKCCLAHLENFIALSHHANSSDSQLPH